MSTIDQRVVEMRFDNRQFESGVATTMSTLDKFKQSLNFGGATKGLENVGAAAKKCDMSALGSAVETVRAKFSALEVMGVTALANITNSAVNTGKRMISALTIDPIKTGFAEYETQINAVQTILANTQSKGTTITDVNAALDELNTYADKTIYNFTEMTRNIGTFTAAGIDLDTSVNAIQGIANLAAVSGSTSQQASTAMYQLSQALATGTVKLMDWNSVVNAGMGGQVFQDALKKTSEELGTGAEAAIKANGSFRESLQTGWLTSEVLTETLKKFTTSGANEYVAEYTGLSKEAVDAALESAEAQYGEADAIEKAAEALAEKSGKSKDEIKQALQFAKTAEDAATKVKTFSQLWDTLKEAAQSGWTQTWEIIVGDFEEAKELLTNISNVIGKVIGDSANARNELLQGWKDAGGRADLIEGFKNAFDGLVNIVKPIKEAFREIFPPTTVDQLVNFTKGFKDLTARFKEFTSGHGEQIKSIFKGIFSVLDIGWSVVKALAGGVATLTGYIFGFSGSFLDAAAAVGDWLSNLRNSIQEVDIFGKAIDKVKEFVALVVKKFQEFTTASSEAFSSDKYEGFLGLMKAIWDIISAIGSALGKVFSALAKGFGEAFSGLDFNQIFGALNGGIFASILLTIRNFTKGLFDCFGGDGGVFENIKGILDDVRGCFQAYQDQLKAGTLLKIAGAIGILAAAILVISTIDHNTLSASLAAITVLFGELMGSLAIFTKISGDMKGVVKGTTVMIGMSVALVILASALKKLSTVDPEGLVKGLVGIGALMTELSIFMRTAKFDGKMVGTATGIVILSSAMLILANAAKSFAAMSWEEMGRGLAGIGALLAELAIFSNLTGNAKHVISTGLSMVLLGASMKIFASAVKDFAGMQWEEIGRGLAAMAGALTAVTIAMNLMPKNMLSLGVGLLGVSAAMLVLANAMSSFGGMSWEEIGKGLAAMGGALLELTIALNLMNGTLAGSAALIVAAGALLLLVPVMQSLGGMSWAEIGKGLITIAGAFTVIGVAGLLLTPLVPSILGLGAALALIGVAVLAAGVGLTAAAAGLTAFAAAGTTGAVALVAALGVIITGVIGLVPTIVQAIGNAIIQFCAMIVAAAPAIGEAITALVLALVDVIVSCAPALISGVVTILTLLLTTLDENLPMFVQKAVSIAVGFIEGLCQGLADNLPRIIEAIKTLGQAILDEILGFFGIHSPSTVFADVGTNLISGLINGVKGMVSSATQAVVSLGQKLVSTIGSKTKEFLSKGKEFISNLATGIKNKISSAKSAAKEVVTKAISSVKEKVSEFKDAGKNLLDGFVDGIKSKMQSAANAAKEIGESALNSIKSFLGIHSPSTEAIDVAEDFVDGFVKGEEDNVYKAEDATADMGDDILTTMSDTLSEDKVSDIGGTLPENIASGIANSTSGEEAAAAKAQSIVDTFKQGFESAELDTTTFDLEQKLWTAMNPNATDSEKYSVQADILSAKYQNQLEQVALAEKEYAETLEAFGEQSDYTQKAYNKLLNEQIDLHDLANQISEANANITSANQAAAEKNNQALLAYNQELNETKDFLLQAGFTMEEIQAAAMKKTGYDPNFQLSAGNLTSVMSSAVSDMGKAIETAGTSDVKPAVQTLSNQCVDVLKADRPKWVESGRNVVLWFVEGMKSALETATEVATELADTVYSAVMDALTRALSESGAGRELGVTPVLDLTNLQNGASQINDLFGSQSVALNQLGSVSLNGLGNVAIHAEDSKSNNNDDVVSAINELRGDVNSLNSAMSGMTVRMDSGAVVGQIVGKMDNSLGQIAAHKGRGN